MEISATKVAILLGQNFTPIISVDSPKNVKVMIPILGIRKATIVYSVLSHLQQFAIWLMKTW